MATWWPSAFFVSKREVDAIHRSLSALGNVIDALTSSSRTSHRSAPAYVQMASSKVWAGPTTRHMSPRTSRHIPYRDSKLTFVLSNCLGGNAKTHIVTTVDPCVESFESTLATLRFAQRAKQVRNRPVPVASSTFLKASSERLQQLVAEAQARALVEDSRQVRAGVFCVFPIAMLCFFFFLPVTAGFSVCSLSSSS